MKTNILTHTAVLLILIGSFSSCDKEYSSVYTDSENFRLTKILHYSNSTSREPARGVEYKYDKVGNMIKESFYDYQPTTILWTYKEYEYSGGKKVKMTIFDRVSGNLRLGQYVDYIYVDDRLVKEETYIGFDGTFYDAMNYEYDERGNLVRQYRYEPEYGITLDYIYVYDQQNRLILEENTVFGIANLKYINYTYDDSGRKTKMEYYFENWDLYRGVEMSYKGMRKSPETEIHYDNNGIQTRKIQYVYDKSGNPTESLYYDENEKYIGKVQTLYDKWGNQTETISIDGCSLFKRKYNGKLLIEEIHYWNVMPQVGGGGDCSPESGKTRYEYEKI